MLSKKYVAACEDMLSIVRDKEADRITVADMKLWYNAWKVMPMQPRLQAQQYYDVLSLPVRGVHASVSM